MPSASAPGQDETSDSVTVVRHFERDIFPRGKIALCGRGVQHCGLERAYFISEARMAFAVHDRRVRPIPDPLSHSSGDGDGGRCRHKPWPVQYGRWLLLAGRHSLCICNRVGDTKRGKCPGNASSCLCSDPALPRFWILHQKTRAAMQRLPTAVFRSRLI